MVDRHTTVLLDEPDDGTGNRPEVLRGDLRRILLESLPETTIKWSHKLTSVTPLGDGRHELHLDNEDTTTTDLLVGADGAWSQVRALVTDAKPSYTGISFVETYLHNVDARHTATAHVVGDGGMSALEPGRGLMAQRESGNVIHTYIGLAKLDGWTSSIDASNQEAVLAHTLAEFNGWAPELTALVTDTDTPPVRACDQHPPRRAPVESLSRRHAARRGRAPHVPVRRRGRKPRHVRRLRTRQSHRSARRSRSSARRLRTSAVPAQRAVRRRL